VSTLLDDLSLKLTPISDHREDLRLQPVVTIYGLGRHVTKVTCVDKAQEAQKDQGVGPSGPSGPHPENEVYSQVHRVSLGDLHGQLKDIYSIDCYYPKLLPVSCAPYSFDIGLNSLITSLVIHPD
jgi:hypothetical protein